MKQVNHKEFSRWIKKAHKTKVSLITLGGTGIGKSQTVKATAQKMARERDLKFSENLEDKDAFRLIDFRLADKEPADLRGIPDIDGDRVRWKLPEFLPERGQGLLLLEEFNLAPEALQAPAYQLILDRQMDSYNIPEGFGVIALGNRVKDNAGVYELFDPLKDRFFWNELTPPNPEDWTDWAMNHDIDSRIISFIQANPNFLYKPPCEDDDTARDVKTFPTPRGWELVSKVIKDEPDEQLKFWTTAKVGQAVATQLYQFQKLTEVLDLEELLAHPLETPLPSEIDRTYALVSQLSQRFKGLNSKRKRQSLLETLCKIAGRLQPEFSRLLIRLTKKIKPKLVERELPRTDSFEKLANEQGKYVFKEL